MFGIRHLVPFVTLVVVCSANMQHSQQQQQQQQQHAQQQQQHSHPAYIIPTVNRQSNAGALSALAGLGQTFGNFGGFGGGSGSGGGAGGSGGLQSLFSSLSSGFSGGSMLSTALPLLMVVGLGAMLVPLIGGAFFRESQKRGLPSVSPLIVDGVTDILERFIKALDAVEKKHK